MYLIDVKSYTLHTSFHMTVELGVCNRWTGSGELDWSAGLEHWTGVLEHWSTGDWSVKPKGLK